MVDGNKDDLHKKTARIQRLKASLKLQDYNPKRDFVGWGGEDFRRLAGMPGFTTTPALASSTPRRSRSRRRLRRRRQARPLPGRGEQGRAPAERRRGFSEIGLPGLTGGARAAVWADYNGDGLPDLLLATPTGPRLYTNLGKGQFRDDTHLLPKEAGYNLTAAAWIDYDGDGKPDILLGNGFHGLRLYRNNRPADAAEDRRRRSSATGTPSARSGSRPGRQLRHRVPAREGESTAKKKYKGKSDMPSRSGRRRTFADGAVNNLAPSSATTARRTSTARSTCRGRRTCRCRSAATTR